MIENGHLVHGQIDSSIQSWQPDSLFLNGLILAVLATILSYQSTSLLYDVFLGIKPRGEVTAPNMHMLLLADEGSPLSVAAALFRRDEFDRARFYGDIPKTTTVVRNRARIAKATIVKLFLVLLTAPLINLIAVFLALEQDEDVSFAAAGFTPVAYGFDKHKNLTLDRDDFAAKCFRIRTSFSSAADEHAQFFFCLELFVDVTLDEPSETTEVAVIALPNGQLQASLRPGGRTIVPLLTSHIAFFTEGNVYRIALGFTQEDLQGLADDIAAFMDRRCPSVEQIEVSRRQTVIQAKQPARRVPKSRNDTRQNILTASQTLECPTFTDPSIPSIILDSLPGAFLGFSFESANLTLVDSDVFRVVNVRDLPVDGSEPAWFDGSDLTLLKRRKNFVPIGILFIVVGALLLVRLLVECITNNDVYDGIDEVIARNVGLPNSFSMIRSDRLMRYDHKYQTGLAAHYGIARPGLPEVREFKGGSVGVGAPGDPFDSQDAAKYYGEEIMNPTRMD